MCAICGCSNAEHDHREHGHGHPHIHARENGTTIALERDVLAKNDKVAERNRGWLAGRDILALNLMSSPGSGKTTLLERTIRELQAGLTISVLGGDQETQNDAERIAATGCKTLQINTGKGCHLDAQMIAGALRELDPEPRSVLMIENVGNLVCPALFDLGEDAKVGMLSGTEGEDKPLKYPHMFRAADLVLLTKCDLLPHLDFDVDRCVAYARRINPRAEVLRLSARTGDGVDARYGWLRNARDRQRETAFA
jgi:hydrogenase nickel incorporation protein HypB